MSLYGGEEREARERGKRKKEGEWGGVGGEKEANTCLLTLFA